MDSYVSWRETALAVQDAYDRWARPARAGCDDRDVAFAGYSAALQQESQAALIYQQQLERVQERRGSPGRRGAAPPWWGVGALGPLREW